MFYSLFRVPYLQSEQIWRQWGHQQFSGKVVHCRSCGVISGRVRPKTGPHSLAACHSVLSELELGGLDHPVVSRRCNALRFDLYWDLIFSKFSFSSQQCKIIQRCSPQRRIWRTPACTSHPAMSALCLQTAQPCRTNCASLTISCHNPVILLNLLVILKKIQLQILVDSNQDSKILNHLSGSHDSF